MPTQIHHRLSLTLALALIICAPAGLSQLLPPADAEAAADSSPDPAASPIPPDLLKVYFAQRPETFLLDPQQLLAKPERNKREAFLQYHSSDSKIDLYVMVFDHDQSLPPDIRIEELGERFFGSDKSALLALCFYGAPERSILEFSPNLREKVNAWQGSRILQESVQDASESSSPATQLEKFCTQISIRLSMLESKIGFTDDGLSANPSPSPLSPLEKPDNQSAPFEPFQSLWHDWGLPISLLIGTVLAGILTSFVLACRRCYHAPACDTTAQRLGCPHAAGVGAKVSFSPATRSPSEQKGSPHDSLGGL